ncbi:MAG: DUF2207 domain-containing protein [Thermodesulfobacteriota bacterium]
MKSYTKLFKLTIFFILILILFVSPAFAQYFTINQFHSDITIHPDSSFIVKETVDVRFDRARHGIYREIPFRYRDDFGKTIETPTEVLSVTDGSGKAWKFQVRKTRSVINIRMGDAKQYVSGKQTYVITYRVENAVLFFKDHDELYWNVTGNEWRAPIQGASADVTLAVKEKSKDLWAAGYTGRYGSKESECVYETYDNGGKFFSKKTLNPGEGFTIAFGWDKGLVSPPSSWKRFLWATGIKENWVFLLPLASFIFMLNHWYRRGRDPRVRESIRVMYEPPKFDNQPLTPAEVGTLLDERLDSRDIISTIVGLAVKGYLQIEETKRDGLIFDSKDYYLKRLKGPDGNLGPVEKKLMETLFATGLPGTHVSDLKNRYYVELEGVKKVLYEELVRKKYFLRSPQKTKNSYARTGFLVMILAFFVFLFLIPGAVAKNILAGIFTGLPVVVFAGFMPAKTRAGASVYMDILGFQEFMDRAEKDRLERMKDKDLFSRFLPYAIALGVADHWAKAFEGIYQEPPNWYASPGGFGTFRPYDFSHSIDSVTSALGSAMFSAPRGSGLGGGGGGGGGGSSGGGFGGGGGGSW